MIIIFAGLLVVTASLFFAFTKKPSFPIVTTPILDETPKGVSCNPSTGFSYSEEVGVCIRESEIAEGDRAWAKKAVDYLVSRNALYKDTVYLIKTLPYKCPGCFDFYFDTRNENTLILVSVRGDQISMAYTDRSVISALDSIMEEPITLEPDTTIVQVTAPGSMYTCPVDKWVDCMPPLSLKKVECTEDYLNWATANCPGFEGAAY